MNRDKKMTLIIESHLEEELPVVDGELPTKVLRVLTCIHENLLNEEQTVSQLYRKCYVKSHNFSAKFAYHLGKTPKQYIEYHRIAIAKKLLSAPTLREIPISTIAFEAGFSTAASFSRLFKRKTGLTPTEWREKNQ